MKMYWKVNTPSLLKEIVENGRTNGLGEMVAPVNIFKNLLTLVAVRASELNDPALNALMCRLALYGVADPYDRANYDPILANEVLNHPEAKEFSKRIAKIKLSQI